MILHFDFDGIIEIMGFSCGGLCPQFPRRASIFALFFLSFQFYSKAPLSPVYTCFFLPSDPTSNQKLLRDGDPITIEEIQNVPEGVTLPLPTESIRGPWKRLYIRNTFIEKNQDSLCAIFGALL